MKLINYFFKTILQLHLPVIKGTVFFSSFQGLYNDNPKYISEKLHSQFPELKIVWARSSDERSTFPSYVKTVIRHSKEYCKYISRAEVVIDNYVGSRHVFSKTNNPLKRFIFKRYSRKKRGQLNISTWHGTPLKHITLDEPEFKKNKYSKLYANADILLAGCQLTANAFKTAFCWNKEVSMFGTPRNDILFSDTVDKNILRTKLSLPQDKKIILFAPTFRNSVNDSGLNQMNALDFDALFQTLKEKFGGDWCFVFRVHNNVLPHINVEEIVEKFPQASIINGNLQDDMAEYLLCTDVLITDYSGSMFDFALTRKPCFLYAPDRMNYEYNERGFYIEYESTPFSISETTNELLENIRKFDYKQYAEKIDEFLIRIGNVEDGNASQRVVETVKRFLDSKNKNGKKQ